MLRSKRDFMRMSDLVDRLTWRGNTKIGILDLVFPFPINEFGEIYFRNIIPKDLKNRISIELSISPIQRIQQAQRVQQIQVRMKYENIYKSGNAYLFTFFFSNLLIYLFIITIIFSGTSLSSNNIWTINCPQGNTGYVSCHFKKR